MLKLLASLQVVMLHLRCQHTVYVPFAMWQEKNCAVKRVLHGNPLLTILSIRTAEEEIISALP